jgi:Putative peptidoglycan binding domain
MRFGKSIAVAVVLLSVALPASAMHARRGPTSHLFVKKHLKRGFKPVVGMSTDRATQIQTALIKAGYMSGEPTGTWDSQSELAMQKLQGDNGWQTKITPDSRALIKLGLGPNSNTSETATSESTASAAQNAAN